MIKNVYVTNYLDETLVLNLTRPEQSGFVINSIDGLGPVKASISTNQVLYHDGSIYSSARLNERNILFDLEFFETPTENVETLRLKSYRIFPVKKKVTITVETDAGYRYCTGYVESNEPTIFSKDTSTTISVICPDPYWYDINNVVTIFTGTTPSFEFPLENQSLINPLISMGTVYINTEANVPYLGGVPTGVLIVIDFLGAVTNLAIVNLSTSETMVIDSTKLIALTGLNFMAGDKVYINTISGSKSIYLYRQGVWISLLNCIDIVADWFELHPGDNLFTYTANTGVGNVRLYMEHKTLFEGI